MRFRVGWRRFKSVFEGVKIYSIVVGFVLFKIVFGIRFIIFYNFWEYDLFRVV